MCYENGNKNDKEIGLAE